MASNSNESEPEVAVEVMKLLKVLQTRKGLRAEKFCYSAALYAWSRSTDIDKATNAYEILREMRENSISIDVLNYITVMNACVHTKYPQEMRLEEKHEKQHEIFTIAKATFKELQADNDTEMNEIAYAVFLRCIRVLQPHHKDNEGNETSLREKLIVALFKKICSEGLLSERIVTEFMSGGEERLFQILFKGYREETAKEVWEKVPFEWKSNVGKMVHRDWRGNIASSS